MKWTIINTFKLCRPVVDPDTWDWFGTQEWYFHWTRPYFQAVWFRVKIPLFRPSQAGSAAVAWVDRITCFQE